MGCEHLSRKFDSTSRIMKLVTNKKLFVALTTLFITASFLLIFQSPKTNDDLQKCPQNSTYHHVDDTKHGNWRKLSDEEKKKFSTLGRILFLEEEPPISNSSVQYKILVWKYGSTIENRHLQHFSGKKFDPFEKCSVKNCEITYEGQALESADIVIFHLHRMKGLVDLPKGRRKAEQIWAFLTDESPYHTFLSSKNKLQDFNGIFNWSMTYRMDSDIPVPYGRTVVSEDPQDFEYPTDKKNDVLVAVMGSNCGGRNNRWRYVRELQKYIKVDVYGHCGPLKCPGHFQADCKLLSPYKFYLSFENSNCDSYITEKLWWNGYHKNAIPIVMGASQKSYSEHLPPYSYINTEDFASPRDLATYLYYLNCTSDEINHYFGWKRQFKVLNEHGYFKSNSFHYCRVCEALNYNDRQVKVYNDLGEFWGTKDCHASWDA